MGLGLSIFIGKKRGLIGSQVSVVYSSQCKLATSGGAGGHAALSILCHSFPRQQSSVVIPE